MIVKRPQEWLRLILSGQIDMTEAPPAIQSWARFSIYEGAVELVRMDTSEERKEGLAKVPASVRPYVEAEVLRIWPWRKTL